MSLGHAYLLLLIAIVSEVIATTALATSQGFSRLMPSIVTVIGYGIAFWMLALVLKVMPTGIVYAIWSGLGIVLVTIAAWFWSKQTLDGPALIGLGLIVAGVLVINLFSKSVSL